MIRRWWVFTRERFDPASHLVMIAVLVGADLALLRPMIFGAEVFPVWKIILCFVIALMFFFHLRLFDEIKDYQTDLSVNRDRPLPRGLISMKEFKSVLYIIMGAELALTSAFGAAAFVAYLIPWSYSILMYREFFIGPWLRPKMEAYAISHTFVSGLLVLFFAVLLSQTSVDQLPLGVWLVVANNWMIFNTFEFARKTFGKQEERPHVESYSNRWGSWGAFIWVASFSAISLSLLIRLDDISGWGQFYLIAASSITAMLWLAGLSYSLVPRANVAKIYRAIASIYLIFINLIVLIFGWWLRPL